MENGPKNSTNYIKVSRRLLNWEWAKDPRMMSLWINLLLCAKWQDTVEEGVTLHRGELATSYRKLSDQTGMNVNTIRACLTKLVGTGEIELRTGKAFSVIKILKYDDYQAKGTAEKVHTPLHTQNHTHFHTPNDDKKTLNKAENEGCIEKVHTPLHTQNHTHFHTHSKKYIKKYIKNYIPPLPPTGESVIDQCFDTCFEAFFEAYPVHADKDRARRAFSKLCTSDEAFCSIMAGIEKYNEVRFAPMAANGRERYIPYASTWLRRKAWQDEPIPFTPDRAHKSGRVEALPEYMKNPPKESKDASPEYIEAFRKMLKLRAVVMDIDDLQSGYMTDEKRAKLEKILSQHTEEEWRGMYKDAQDALEKIQNAEEEE